MVQRIWATLVGFRRGVDATLSQPTLLKFIKRALTLSSPVGANSPSAARAPASERWAEARNDVATRIDAEGADAEGAAVDVTDAAAADMGAKMAGEMAAEQLAAAADAEMAQLCADFAAMYRGTLAYKTTRNVREEVQEVLEEEEVEECTFAPVLSKKSLQIERERKTAHDAAKAAAAAAADAPAADFQSASAAFAKAAAAASALGNGKLPAGSGVARQESLYAHARAVESRRQQKVVAKAEEAMEECSFKPSINAKSSTGQAGGKSLNPGAMKLGPKRFHHLHEQAVKSQQVVRAQPTSLDKEVEECTFKPHLNDYRPGRAEGGGGIGRGGGSGGPATPSGYQQAVNRMRRVGEEKEQAEADAVVAARKRASLAGKPPQPFALHTDRRAERRHPLLYMDINLGHGKSGRIGLHGDDDPNALAANFARAYQLDDAMQTKLAGLIETYLREVVPDIGNEQPEMGTAAPSTPAESAAPALPTSAASSSRAPSSRSPKR